MAVVEGVDVVMDEDSVLDVDGVEGRIPLSETLKDFVVAWS